MSEVFRGIVLKEVAVGEKDKIITLLAKDVGKLSISCKGSRGTTSKTASGTTLFTYGDYNIFTGLKHLRLNNVYIIKSFYKISYDYDSLVFASYFVEVIDKTTFQNEENNDILYLLLHSLNALETKKNTPMLTSAIFNIKLVQLLGFTPILDVCSFCGKENFEPMFFGDEGVVCKNCNHNYPIVKKETIYIINYILSNNIKDIFNFNVNHQNILILYNLSLKYLKNHTDIKINSLDILGI